MKKCLFTLFMLSVLCLSSCTYTISMVQSDGESTDAVDATSDPDPVISPTVTVPVTP